MNCIWNHLDINQELIAEIFGSRYLRKKPGNAEFLELFYDYVKNFKVVEICENIKCSYSSSECVLYCKRAYRKAELVAIYGRRRVGKTYLVDKTFADKITFGHAGLSPADEDAKGLLRLQLDHFYNSLELQGMARCEKPTNWLGPK